MRHIHGQTMIGLQSRYKNTGYGIDGRHVGCVIGAQTTIGTAFTPGTDHGQNFGHVTHIGDTAVPVMIEMFGFSGIFGATI